MSGFKYEKSKDFHPSISPQHIYYKEKIGKIHCEETSSCHFNQVIKVHIRSTHTMVQNKWFLSSKIPMLGKKKNTIVLD